MMDAATSRLPWIALGVVLGVGIALASRDFAIGFAAVVGLAALAQVAWARAAGRPRA